MRRHLLVTNDFPPKVGGIQNYLFELWRRLPAASAHVYTTPHDGAVEFDLAQPFWIERSPEPVLLPYPWLVKRIDRLADQLDVSLVLLDPAVPLGLIGPQLKHRYGVVLHGAEVTIPGRLPGLAKALRSVLEGAALVVSAGEYALAEAERCVGHPLPSVVIPPGVDHAALQPVAPSDRLGLRRGFGYADTDVVLCVVTRLVPRKGIHTLIDAAALLAPSHPDLRLVIGGVGRESGRLRDRAASAAVRADFLGRISDREKAARYAAADLMAMPCNQRWGGLEQEGFGIVFLEAAAAGLPQIAGRSGGADEAVADGVTGLVVGDPDDPRAVADAIATLLDDPERRAAMGCAARRRAVADFDYQRLADRLDRAIEDTIRSASTMRPSSTPGASARHSDAPPSSDAPSSSDNRSDQAQP